MKRTLLFLSSVLALALPLAASEKRVPTIDELIGLTRPSEPTISPDGRFVAYVVRQPNWDANIYEREIWLTNTQTGESKQLTKSRAKNWDLSWSPDGRWLGFISDRAGSPQIFVVSQATGEPRQITKTDTGVSQFHWSPDGSRIAFTVTDPPSKQIQARKERYTDFEMVGRDYQMDHLWVIDANGTGMRRLTSGESFTVDSFSWSPEGDRIAFDARTTPSLRAEATSNIYLYSFDINSVKKLLNEQGPDRNPQWSPDGKQIAFESALGKPDFYTPDSHIAIVPAEGGHAINLTSAFDERPSLVAWAPDGIYFTAEQKTASYIFRLNPANHAIQRLTPQDGAAYSSFTFAADFKQYAFVEADSTHYPEVYFSSANAFAPKKITNFGSQRDGFTVARREVISWKNSEGTPIEGALMKPANFDPNKSYPLLVVVHGGPGDTTSQAIPGFDIPYYPKEIWAARGALILEPNYRGSAGYGEAFHRRIVRTLGTGDYDDIISGVDYLVAKGWVDKERVGIMGWSFGGFISAWMATNTDRFRAVSVGAGTADWALFYASSVLPAIPRQYLAATPWSDAEIYRKSSPVTYISQARTPTMIEHGEFDPFAPLGGAYELYQGLLDHNVPVRFYLYKGFGHSITSPKGNRAVMEHNLNWFNHYLWGDPDSDASQ